MKESEKYILWLLVSFIVAGIAESPPIAEILPVSGAGFTHAIIISVLIFAWCGMHAVEHGNRTGGGYRLFAALLPPIGIPSYFIKYFGIKNGLMKSGKSLGVFILMCVAYTIPYVLLSYDYA